MFWVRRGFDTLSRMLFVESAEQVLILGEPHTKVYRTLDNLLTDGIVGRVNHSTICLPSRRTT